MDVDVQENAVVLNERDLEIAQFLKRALECKTDAEVVSESLHATRHVVRVIRAGGTVILRERDGTANKMIMKT